MATADGGTDVSEVIAAIDWIVQHRTDDGLDIRIINLSYATDAVQDAGIDPLAYAAEQAWKQGLVVVAAGGNYGFQSHMNSAPALGDPALDRYVVAVGSSDSLGTPSLADDVLPAFSPWPKRGATRGVDLVAPGVHIQGLRVANTLIDANHPEGLINGRYFRGSGTSQSAAIVSGAGSADPGEVPRCNARPGQEAAHDFRLSDQGQVTSHRCGRTSAGTRPRIPTAELDANMGVVVGNRLPRGFSRLESHPRDGVVLSGEEDIFGAPVDTTALAAAEATGNSWSGGVWNGNSWSGDGWSGNSWSGNSWSSSVWSGNSWSGNSWSSSVWSGNSWSGSSWSDRNWAGAVWG